MNHRTSRSRRGAGIVGLAVAAITSSAFAAWPAPPAPSSTAPKAHVVEIFWDEYGVAHIDSGTNEGAYFGMGYACARDRLGQMLLKRLRVYGRLAEFFEPPNSTQAGYDPFDPSDNAFLSSDLRMRQLGTKRLAKRVVDNMDPAMEELLEAYAAGVEQYVSEIPSWPPAGLPDDFDDPALATVAANWKPKHIVALWLEFSQFLSQESLGETDDSLFLLCGGNDPGTTYEELIECINANSNVFPVYDEVAAAVQQEDMPEALRNEIAAYAAQHGVSEATKGITQRDESLKFSQTWAVGSDLMTNESPARSVLFGHPQLPFGVPNHFWEADVKGADFRVRGAAVPGTPNFVVGSNEYVAWSATALGVDQWDLFQVPLDPSDPERYLLNPNGPVESFAWDKDVTETVKVKVPPPTQQPLITVRYRETWWGPVLPNEMLVEPENGFPPDAVYSLRGVLFARPHLNPHQGFLETYRAQTAEEFRLAVGGGPLAQGPGNEDSSRGGITFPSYNLVFADRDGNVGYCPAGSVPLRDPDAPLGGELVQDGSDVANDWDDIIPHDYKPWKIAQDSAYSANHLPVGAWYPLPFAGHGGHTYRSRSVKERLDALGPQTTIQDVYAIYFSDVLVKQRDYVRLGMYVYENGYDDPNVPGTSNPYPFNDDALRALGVGPYASNDKLADWAGSYLYSQQGGNDGSYGLSTLHPANGLAIEVGKKRKFSPGNVGLELVETYGNNKFGFVHWARCKLDAINAAPCTCPEQVDCGSAAVFSQVEADYLNDVLCEAWYRANNAFENPPQPACEGNQSPVTENCCGWTGGLNESAWPAWFFQQRLHGDPAYPLKLKTWKNPLLSIPSLEKGNPYEVSVAANGPFSSVAISTIMSQEQQAYSQLVPLGPELTAPPRSMCPIGQSERFGDAHYDDQVDEWVSGFLRDSPMLEAPWSGATPSASIPDNPRTLTY